MQNLHNSGDYALVTGASQGPGRAIAKELASNGYNLLLVSLSNEKLQELCDAIKCEYSVDCHGFEANLARPEAVYQIYEWALAFKPLNVLVNNAGIGGSVPFDQASTEYLDNIMTVNMRSLVLLTRLVLPLLRENMQSFILNVASMDG